MPEEREKVIEIKADGQLVAKSPLLLIERKSGPVWAMNQLFIAPGAPEGTLDQVMKQVEKLCQETGLKVWPLDPHPTGIFAYFLAPSDWSQVDCWAWNNTDNFTGGKWPGVACTKTGVKKNGLDVWMWKYDGDLTTAPTMIIFSNGGGQQTKDLVFGNGAVYNLAGKTNESVSTGINQVGSKKAPAKLKIYSINGVKVAEVGSMADAEYILAPGVYVCGGKKYVIK